MGSADRLRVIDRIIAAGSHRPPAGTPGVASWAQARACADEMNHLLGAVTRDEYVGAELSNLVLSPELLATLLRAARGERVTAGRLLFNPTAADRQVARG